MSELALPIQIPIFLDCSYFKYYSRHQKYGSKAIYRIKGIKIIRILKAIDET